MSDLLALFRTARTRWWVVVALTVAGALAGAILAATIPVTYTASSRVFIATPTWNDSTASPQPGYQSAGTSYGDEFTQQRMPSYLELMGSPVIIDPTAEKLSRQPSDVAAHLSARLVPDTVIMEITGTGSSADDAAQIANTAAAAFVNAVTVVEKPAFNKPAPVQPVIIDQALPPTAPVSPNLALLIMIGASLGLVLGLVCALYVGVPRAATGSDPLTDQTPLDDESGDTALASAEKERV